MAPMYAVTAVKKGKNSYVVCGGFDKSIYYLNSKGEMVKEIKSSTFSIQKPVSQFKSDMPKENECTANFIRPIPQKNGDDILAVLGTNNHMNVAGTMYLFNIFEDKPFKKDKISIKGERVRVMGDIQITDTNGDGNMEVILGSSAHSNDASFIIYNPLSGELKYHPINKLRFGYDVAQTITFQQGNEPFFLTMVRDEIRINKADFNVKSEEKIMLKDAYFDLWKDSKNKQIILASAQSGGSCIHIINTEHKDWKKEISTLKPIGKIASILKNTEDFRNKLKSFEKPAYQREAVPVYLMTESVPASVENLKNSLVSKYHNPIFLNSGNIDKEKWDRSSLGNEKYSEKRDRRMKYTLTQKQILDKVKLKYENEPGYAYWAGHGNDPYMYQKETTQKIMDLANGKKTVLILPEMEDHSDDLQFLVDDLIYPLASYGKTKNANIFLRSKNVFWLGSNYLKPWEPLMSGKYADVFVPAMEETTDKTMELSLAGRLGMWTSGAVNSWGSRVVPDNTAFDRSRQYGSQQLPNHFLRNLVYHLANGVQYLDNFPVDQDYLSVYWELIAKGALYVPKREEIISFSPVHLSMKSPDEHFLDDGSNVKWTTYFDEAFEKNNPFVFSRMRGNWPGAPVTEWDFSNYAAGVKERRSDFLPTYANGLVLITPPQKGVFAQKNVVRKPLKENLHPLYKNIMKEYITDGRNYYSADGKETYKADEYYKVIEKDIQESAKKLPITVSGDVSWVAAQTSPKHIRLTIIDGGYINPNNRKALVTFNTIQPLKMTDIVDGKSYDVKNNKTVEVDIPLGLFRFIEIELKDSL